MRLLYILWRVLNVQLLGDEQSSVYNVAFLCYIPRSGGAHFPKGKCFTCCGGKDGYWVGVVAVCVDVWWYHATMGVCAGGWSTRIPWTMDAKGNIGEGKRVHTAAHTQPINALVCIPPMHSWYGIASPLKTRALGYPRFLPAVFVATCCHCSTVQSRHRSKLTHLAQLQACPTTILTAIMLTSTDEQGESCTSHLIWRK